MKVIRHLLENIPGLDPDRVDDVIVGNAVPEAEQGLQMARWIALMAITRRYLVLSSTGIVHRVWRRSPWQQPKLKPVWRIASLPVVPNPCHWCPSAVGKPPPNYKLAKGYTNYLINMGLTGEEVADQYKVSREDQDRFALRSHQNAVNATKNGLFEEQIAPVETEEVTVENGERKSVIRTVTVDEGPRKDTDLESLSKLKPVFRQNGTITAGNASQRSDGAAFVLLMSERLEKKLNLEPAARLAGCAVAGVDRRIIRIGPAKSIPKVLRQTDLKIGDIDLIEINEAFAAQTLAVMRALDLDEETLNVNGGAIATGHPLGATGCKLTIQTIHELRRRKKKYGMVSACVGGGQGIAGIVELLK